MDLTDLLAVLVLDRAPMGVARVQMGLLEAGLEPGAAPLFDLAAFSAEQGCFVTFPAPLLLTLIRGARAGGRRDAPSWLALRDAADTARATGQPFRFAPGDRVLALGLTGNNPAQLRRLRELRRQFGAVICVLFYDAIPLAAPEHCEPGLSRSFAEHLLALCLQMDRAIAISACSARDFTLWQRRMLPQLDIPVDVMPLNARFAAPAEEEPAELPERLRDGRPFVLCVATIESRKNHLLLLHAWLTLLRRHGDAVIPDLVLVGRPGYQGEAALHLMQAAPELRRRVLHLQDIGDGLLRLLYARCLFTVFNSFHEGWGLPVTEALAHGKLALTPDHTSLREAGGAAALYFTPQSEPELAELAWSLIRDPGHRQRLEAKIAERLPIRSWREVAEGLIATVRAEKPQLPEPASRVFFPLGERVGFDQPTIPDLPELPPASSLLHQMICEGEGWGSQERWGIGASWGVVRLRMPLWPPPEGPLLLTLEVATPAELPTDLRVRVINPGAEAGPWMTNHLAPGKAHLVRVEIAPCEPGELVVEFDLGAPPPEGGRLVRLFFTGLMLCAAADHGAQIRYLSARSGVTALRSG